jgi:hypothetical protein
MRRIRAARIVSAPPDAVKDRRARSTADLADLVHASDRARRAELPNTALEVPQPQVI